MIRGLTGLGKTIFLTTHFMDEAQRLADRVAVIARGTIVAQGSPDTLGGRDRDVTTVRFGLSGGAELPDRFSAARSRQRYELSTTDPTRLLHELTEWALSARVELDGLEVTRPTLEDVYLRLTADAASAADDAEAGEAAGSEGPA
jgi:ABC-2 type transport system ATP-binding protein